MGSATIRCCNKRWEVEFGWRNRNILIIIPYLLIGYVLNTFIVAGDWWGDDQEVLILATNIILLLAPLLALIEINREPSALWYIAVLVAEVGALVACVIFLLFTFEELKNNTSQKDQNLNLDSATDSVGESESDQRRENMKRNWIRWEQCIALIFLSICLLMNSVASRLLKISSPEPANNEETNELQEVENKT